MRLIAFLFAFTGSVAIADCPATPDHSERIGALIAELQGLDTPVGARALTEQLWEHWTDAPDQTAQDLLDQGMSQRSGFDLLGSRDTLDALVEYCPNYAEGYNQRAFTNYLRQDFSAALVDLEKAIELSPNHIAAISGKGLTLMGLGREAEAQAALKEAVSLNPWLSERSLIKEPAGTDI